MTPQTSKQTITIHLLANISQSTGNQAMKFDQLIEHKREIFFSNIVQNLYNLKGSGLQLISIYFDSPQRSIQ